MQDKLNKVKGLCINDESSIEVDLEERYFCSVCLSAGITLISCWYCRLGDIDQAIEMRLKYIVESSWYLIYFKLIAIE